MEIKYLYNKKGSFSETISWAVATVIIVVMLLFYLFFISFAKSELNSDIVYRKFLSNSFEREFYTFLEEKILFEDKNISIKELLKKIELNKAGAYIGGNSGPNSEETFFKKNSEKFFSNSINLITLEKNKISKNVFITIDFFTDPKRSLLFLLSNQVFSSQEIPISTGEDISPVAPNPIDKAEYELSKMVCDLRKKDSFLREAFISKDKKITYCFNY